MSVSTVNIYTDGAASGNPGRGGYGIIMQMKKAGSVYQKEFCQGYKYTTNNRMELMAVIEGLKKLKTADLNIVVFTDSKYVCDPVNKGWLQKWHKTNFKDKKNEDLWREFLELSNKFPSLQLRWVRGHNGHPQNERCDALAVAASKSEDLLVDVGFEN